MERRSPKLGEHVVFDDGTRRRDALCVVSMTEPPSPTVTLLLLRPNGEPMVKSRIPHKSKAVRGEPNYLFPGEEVAAK